MKTPYVSKWGALDGFKVMLVDGGWVRTNKDIQFTNFDSHWHRSYIPHDEVWIDSAVDKGEIPYFARAAVREAKMMRNGATYARAEGVASKIERAERKNDHELHKAVKIRKLASNGKITIYLVDGRAVRDKFDDEFSLGGHGLIYPWIPKDEVWMDDAASPKDRRRNLFHEIYERNRMADGETYEAAHHAASNAESRARRGVEAQFEKMMAREEKRAGGALNLSEKA